jgi:hypothetical protein
MKRLLIIFYCVIAYSIGYTQTPLNDSHWTNQWVDYFNLMSPFFNGSEYFLKNSNNNLNWKILNYHTRGNSPSIILQGNSSILNTGLRLNVNKIYNSTNWIYNNNKIYEFTSGEINSCNTRFVKYGFVEIKAKMNDEYGLWPSFWLLSINGNYEEEIDIFEMIPGSIEGDGVIHDKNIMTSSIHKCNPNILNDPNRYDNGTIIKINDYTISHTYAVEWSPSKLLYYFDGIIIKTENNPFQSNDPKTIILSIGLNPWVHYNYSTGPKEYYRPDTTAWTPNYYNLTNFTNATMDVEYVKYDKLNMDECNLDYPINNIYDLNGYNSLVKKNILIDGTTNIIKGNRSPNVLRASESIIINKNFEVPIGKELYLDVNPCY